MEIHFNSKSQQYGYLSNFDTRGSFTIGKERWQSVEHFYQAQKFEEPAIRSQIQREVSGAAAKKLAQNHSVEVRPDWDQIKEAVMKSALRAKFEQNRALRKHLLETGAATLLHESTSDLFWGCNAEGQGLNRLGELLMEIRAELLIGIPFFIASAPAPPQGRG